MKIFIAGHNGLVGSAIKRRLEKEDVSLLFASRGQLDLLRQDQVNYFLEANQPDVVIDAAAKWVGFMQITPTRRTLSTKIFKYKTISSMAVTSRLREKQYKGLAGHP